jgi:ubiquinol-cytochrome c reductase cytochrome b/c1 subunit
VPEWYLLPFYAILRAIPNKLLGVVCLFGAIALLAFLPWLDTSPVKSAKYRPVFRVFFWAFVAVCLGLGWLGSQEVSDNTTLAARLLAFCYFAFFLIVLPLLGLFEKTKPLPASIADTVLGKGGPAAQPAE